MENQIIKKQLSTILTRSINIKESSLLFPMLLSGPQGHSEPQISPSAIGTGRQQEAQGHFEMSGNPQDLKRTQGKPGQR